MKSVIMFGYGQYGKMMLRLYLRGEFAIKIVAIADNNATGEAIEGIPFIKPKEIIDFQYDEIWMVTVFSDEIKHQLTTEYSIDESILKTINPIEYFVENKIKEKYNDEFSKRQKCDSEEKQEVIEYILNNGAKQYCYEFTDKYKKCEVLFDDEVGMYYGLLDSKRMYLSKKFNTLRKAKKYFSDCLMEQDKQSPHCYLNQAFDVECGDIGIDVGAAEGIFALSVIDKVKHIYLVEAEEHWNEALELTFKDYKEKITIVKAFVSDTTNEMCKRMDDLFANHKIDFIKMDIEGEELNALKGCSDIIKSHNPKLAVCTYHHQNDYDEINEWLVENGYYTTNSRGYMLCMGEWELDNNEVDFRRGLIYAKKRG